MEMKAIWIAAVYSVRVAPMLAVAARGLIVLQANVKMSSAFPVKTVC